MSQANTDATGRDELVVTGAQENPVVVLRLNRPHRLNALNTNLVDALESALTQAAQDGRRAIILTGTGRAFSAGFDLKEQRDDDGVHQIEAQQRLGEILTALPVPVIAAINGLAVGGGCEIALACDFVLATSNASFSLPEVRVGTAMGGGSSFLLARAVGRLRASQVVLLGEQITAEEAHAIGLVSRMVDPDHLMTAAEELAAKLAARPPHAVATVKAALFRGLNQTFPEALRAEVEEVHATQFHPDSAAIIERFRQDSTYGERT
ncbi:enoyl-CoA hydratase/isomerase family protein [Actinomadura madurae]|uniref:enoyl-CoA hydratase/isomerase family protein n=1 Tax=Actinomadura madurae TaxID=1993 RepID=UPI00399BD13A